MNSRYTNLFRFFFAALDLCFLNITHILLVLLLDRIQGINDPAYPIYFLFSNMIWLGCAYATAVYVNDRLLDFVRYARRSIRTFLLYFVIILIFIFIYHYSYSRLFIILNFLIFGAILFVSRIAFIWGGYYLQDKNRYNKKVIILGYNEVSKKLVNYFNMNKERVQMEGYFEELENIHELSLYPILGNPDDCLSYAIKHKINEIYSTISPEKSPAIYDLISTAEKNLIRFRFVPDLHLFINRNFYVDYVQEIPILSLRPEPLEDIANRIKKRIFDILFSTLVIIGILSWLGLILALMVKLTSKGPVFFVQFRSGRNNQKFKCYKFRSLFVNNESNSRQVTKDDKRYTKIGKFLRKTNLDELPQFFNVLLGNMSIVGPRPHMLSHTESFSQIINEYMIRQFVKPGITGWAQVNGYRGETRDPMLMKKRVKYDLRYIENWTFWFDLQIVLQTLVNMVKGEKNAF